jgi:hypothetical protein
VIVEHAGFGSTGAAPVARKVMDAYLLGPDGKTLLPAAPRGPYSEPTNIKPLVKPSIPAIPPPAPRVPTQQVADRARPEPASAPPAQ